MVKKCSGCGSVLQTEDKEKEGYIPSSVYEKADFCERCFKIKNYNSPKVLKKDLSINEIIKDEKVPVLFLIDVLTLSNTSFELLKEIKNKVYVILTKIDLLPKSVKEYKLINYVKEHTGNEDIFIVSSTKKYNIDFLYNKLSKENIKRAYVVGFSNAGKSAFINSLLESKGLTSNIVVSSTPNTTLDNIEIKLKDITLIDTPGIINKKSISNYIDSSIYKKLLATKEIKPKLHSLKPGFMILLNNIIRIENNSKETNLSFYISDSIKITKLRIERRDLLKDANKVVVEADYKKDIVLEGIGFIKVIDACTLNFYSKDINYITTRDKLI